MKTTISLSTPAELETESLVAVVLDQSTAASGEKDKKPELKVATADPAVQATAKELMQSLMDLHGAALEKALEIVADATEQLVVIGRAAHPPLEVPEVLDEQVSRAVLADLEVLAARVDAAEDPREPRDQQVVLGDVAPDLVFRERAGGEPLEVVGAPEGALGE